MNNIIIDGHNLAFRALYAFSTLVTDEGLPSGCVYGFLSSFNKLRHRFPFHVTVTWDGGSDRKKTIYPEYKANRSHDTVFTQIDDLKKILSCMGIDQAWMDGEEADDLIATLAVRFVREGQVYIYTADKDMFQLVRNGKVILIRPKAGTRPEKIYDEEAVIKECGVSPQNFACYQAFLGDGSDNVPGVYRVPSKILARLASTYREPRAIYASLRSEKLTDFQRCSIRAGMNQVLVNHDLVKLRTDLSVQVQKGVCDQELLQSYLDRYQIRDLSVEDLTVTSHEAVAFRERKAPAFIENLSLFN